MINVLNEMSGIEKHKNIKYMALCIIHQASTDVCYAWSELEPLNFLIQHYYLLVRWESW